MSGPRLENTRYRIQSVDRAIDVLGAFSNERPELELSEISRITSLTKSTAFRILVTLSLRNLVSYDSGTQRYSLGYAVLHLANIRRRQHSLTSVARTHLIRLRDDLNETVSLSQRVEDHRISIHQEESKHSFRRAPETGEPVPLYAGASGKAFLAAMDPDELDEYVDRIELRHLGPATITDAAALKREVALIREQGFSESYGERSENAGVALAAAVYGADGEISGVIHVSVPNERFDDAMRAQCIVKVLNTAKAISVELGSEATSLPDRWTGVSR